jgi:hypothetical protein
LSAGTRTSPMVSFSILYDIAASSCTEFEKQALP